MSVFLKKLLGLGSACLLCVSGHALTWEAQTLRLTTAPFQKTQEAVFHFKNDSDQSLAILEVQTSCDCLTASSDRKIYPPGTAGVIKGTFTLGDRIGLYERRISVLTDAGETPVQLLLQIEVPALATVAPQSVAWNLAEPFEEKSADLQPASGLVIDFTEIKATNDAFAVRLETIVPGRHYRVHVKPLQPGQRANAAIRISGRESTGHDVLVSAYANVQ